MPALLLLIKGALFSFAFKFLIKFVAAFGIGIVSFKELTDFWHKMQEQFYSGYNSLPSAMIALMDIGGFATALNIMISGISFLVAWIATEQVFRIFKVI